MTSDLVATLRPGDRVYRYWDSGAFGAEPQILTVVRVNRLTVTVRTRYDNEFRCPHADLEGRWSEKDDG